MLAFNKSIFLCIVVVVIVHFHTTAAIVSGVTNGDDEQYEDQVVLQEVAENGGGNTLLDEIEEVEHELIFWLEESLLWIGILIILLVVLPNICNLFIGGRVGDKKDD